MRVRAKAQLSCLADQILQLNHPKLRPAIQFAIALFTLQLGTTIVISLLPGCETMSENVTEFDSPWKQVLERYFKDFILFFFPQAHQDIEWSRGYEFLDKELQQVVRDAELGRRLVDKLIKIYLRGGSEAWVLVHRHAPMHKGAIASKLALTRRLYERQFSREDVLNLFQFIDWVMSLPEELKQDFWQEVIHLEEERRMPYVTSVERIGIQKGIRQGLLEGIELGREPEIWH